MNRIFPPRAFQVNLLNNKNVKKIFLSIIFGVGVLYYKGFYFILGEHNIEDKIRKGKLIDMFL